MEELKNRVFVLDELIIRAKAKGSFWKGDTVPIYTDIIRGYEHITSKFMPISDREAILLHDLDDIIAMKEMEAL